MTANPHSKSGCIPQLIASVRAPDAYPPDLKEVIDADRAWFAEHPDRQYRARLTTPAELCDFERRGATLPDKTIGMVTVVRNFGRSRQRVAVPFNAIWRNPVDLDERAAALLYEQITRQFA